MRSTWRSDSPTRSDSASWLLSRPVESRAAALESRPVRRRRVGDLDGLPGSDSLMLVDEARPLTAVSVGRKPSGVPHGVRHVPGGSTRRSSSSTNNSRLRGRMRRRASTSSRHGRSSSTGSTRTRTPADEARLTLSDGVSRPMERPYSSTPWHRRAPASGVYDGGGAETELLLAPPWHRLEMELPDAAGVRRGVGSPHRHSARRRDGTGERPERPVHRRRQTPGRSAPGDDDRS